MLSVILLLVINLVKSDSSLDKYTCPSSLKGRTRLVNHTITSSYDAAPKNSMIGRVEVCMPITASLTTSSHYWGTICSKRMDHTTHDAICASLHYTDIGKILALVPARQIPRDYESAAYDQPTFLNKLACANGTTNNLAECTYETASTFEDCSHFTDIYLECVERIECNVCKDGTSCNFESVVKETDRCSNLDTLCVRTLVEKDGKKEDFMGCSETTCLDRLAACESGTTCLCNDCAHGNCNSMFLDLLEVNNFQIVNGMVEMFSKIQKSFNFGMRLFWCDISAWLSLFS